MGGDNAPGEIVKGAVDAVVARPDIKVFLVGQQETVKQELAKYTFPAEQIEVVHGRGGNRDSRAACECNS